MKPTKALANAAAAGDLKTMRAMLKKDRSLTVDWQPIMDACLAGQPEAVVVLLENGADPNVKSKSAHQYRPLHRTVEYKKTMPKHDGHQRHRPVRHRRLARVPAGPVGQGAQAAGHLPRVRAW